MKKDFREHTIPASVLTFCSILPVVGYFILLGPLLATFTIASSIEEMKNHELVAATVRFMKTQRALLVLKVLAKLRGMGSRKSIKKRKSSTMVERKASLASNLSVPGKETEIHDPVDTSHIDMPEEVKGLMRTLAQRSHDDWCKAKRDSGWIYGEKRDNENKIHPDLVSFDELGEGGKKYNLEASAETLKVILALGYQMHKKRDRRQSFVARTMQSTKVDFDKLSDMLAANTHQKWAKDKMEAGWVFGSKMDAEAKHHTLLVPYAELDEEHKNVNRDAARAGVQAIRDLGFVFERRGSIRRQRSSQKSSRSLGPLSEEEEKTGDAKDSEAEVQVQRKDIHRVFKMFDKEDDGALHNVDILPALSTLGWAVSPTDAVQIVCEMDPENTGEIEYEAFEAWVMGHENASDNESFEETAASIFSYIDEDQSGHITAQELYEAVRRLGEDIDLEDAQEIVKTADHDGNGSIDIEEFTKMMRTVLKQA